MNNINMNKLLALFTVFATFLGTSYGKTIYVNANFTSRLPAGYRELEYIESVGGTTAAINTDVVIGPASTVEYVSSVLTGTAAGTSMGYYDAANPILNLGGIIAHALRMLDTTTSPTVNVGYDNAFTALFDPFNGLLGINGANNTFSSAGKTFPNKPFHLLNRQGALTNPKARAYSFKHLESGILVKHLVPALDPAGVPCMFDLVASNALYNVGAGSFLYSLGTSWSSPYTNLQDAVTASVAGDLVLVTNGVYSPIATGNKAITIQSVNGYADTIIDGGGVARCISSGGGCTVDGFTVRNGYMASGGTGGGMHGNYSSKLNNSFVTNCIASYGGGVASATLVANTTITGCTAIDGSAALNATVSNCVIRGNTATRSGTAYTSNVMDSEIYDNVVAGDGGGVAYGNIYRSRIYNNVANSSGGGGRGNASQSAYDSIISNNMAKTSGGGLHSFAIVSNCVVVGNIAIGTGSNDGGGGTYNCTTVMDSLISGNIATNGTYTKGGGSYGGTLYRCRVENNLGKEGGGVANSRVYDSVIYGNESFVNSGKGGGYFASSIYYGVSNCVIHSNSAPIGGGIYGGTLRNCVVSNNVATVSHGGGVNGSTVYDSLIVNNSATRYGGGTYVGTLTGCTISGNTAVGAGGSAYSVVRCSVIANNTATTTQGALVRGQYYNCTIYGNTAPDYAVGHANTSATEPVLYNCVVYGNVNTGANARHLEIPASGVFAFSSIDGANRFSTALTPAQFVQSIYGDPLFTNPLLNDFSLRPESPCINKGANQHVTTATDIVGRPRIKDWRVDMGAYENQSQRFAVTPNPLHPMGTKDVPEWTPIPAVAWYKLDGNALDSSGNGYHGTWTGTEAYAAGVFAGTQAGSFDGSSAIILPRPFAYQAITVCAWVERVGFGCFWGNRTDFGPFEGHTVRIHTDGTLYVQVRSGGTWAISQSQSSVSTSWEFLCVSIDGRDIVGYADGVPVIDTTLVADVANATTVNARIGSINSPPLVFFSGHVADVRVFDRALSQANIQRIMESQNNEPLEELQ